MWQHRLLGSYGSELALRQALGIARGGDIPDTEELVALAASPPTWSQSLLELHRIPYHWNCKHHERDVTFDPRRQLQCAKRFSYNVPDP